MKERLKFLIVEDPKAIAIDINSRLKDLKYEVTDIVTSAEKAYDSIQKNRPDVVLMDIQLRGKTDGIQAAEYIFTNYELPVIFLTSRMDMDTIKRTSGSHAYGFVNKPFNDEELKANIELTNARHDAWIALRKERDLFRSMIDKGAVQEYLFVRADYKLNKIKLDDVYYIEALKDYVAIHTGESSFTTHATMKEMMRRLPEKDFVRIHRSYITRIDKIYSIRYPDLVVDGKMKTIPIGGLYRKELYRRLNML